MRILLIAVDFPPNLGGIATASREIARALQRKKNIALTVLAPKLSESRDLVIENDINLVRCWLPRRGGIMSVLPLAFHIWRLNRILKPDVVINMTWMPGGSACWVNSIFSGKKFPPFTVFVHAAEVLDAASTIRKRIKKLLFLLKKPVFAASKRIFCVSKFSANLIENLGLGATNKVAVISNGVDLNKFSNAKVSASLSSRYLASGRKVILTVSRLEPHKGIDFILKALVKLRLERSDFSYLIVGDGPDRTRLRELVIRLKLENCVEFIGKVSEDQLLEYYSVCDIFILNSREDYSTPAVEGFGLVFLEVAACAKPSIGGNSGGIPDAIENGVTGYLVDPRDASDIASKLKSLLDSSELRDSLGQAGYRRASEFFTWDHTATQVLREIKRLDH